MENTSKALLIAAAVLIVILLISFGITILNSTKDSSEDAQAVGESIVSSTSSAKINAILSMVNYKDDTSFKNFLEENYGNGKALSKNEVIELYELVIARTQILYNDNYYFNTIHVPSSKGRGVIYYNAVTKTMDYETLTDKKYYLAWGQNSNSASIAVLIKE